MWKPALFALLTLAPAFIAANPIEARNVTDRALDADLNFKRELFARRNRVVGTPTSPQLRERIRKNQVDPRKAAERWTRNNGLAPRTAPSGKPGCPDPFGGGTCISGGTGSDGCVPYSVSWSSVTLPNNGPGPFGENNVLDLNTLYIPCSQYKTGQSYASNSGWSTSSDNFHIGDSNNPYYGKRTIPLNLPPNTCLVWIQVAEYNQHFGAGGQYPACNCGC